MSLNEKTKNLLSVFFRTSLSVALLAYIYSTIDVDKTVAAVKAADPLLILYAFIIFAFLNVVILLRWMVFIKALGLNAHFVTVARYFFIGLFGNLFLPTAIGGDILKTIGLCGDSSQKPKVVASVLLDRLSGFAGIVVVAIVAFVFGYSLIPDKSIGIAIVVLAVVSSLVGVVLFNEKIYSFCCRIFSPFPRVKKGLMNMHYDIALLKDRLDAIYKGVGISCFAQVFLAVAFFIISKSFHQDVDLHYFVVFVPLICVVSALPSIGGLGVREAGMVYFLAKVGVESGVAVSIGLINFLFMIIVGLVGGVFYATTKSVKSIEV